MHRAIEHFSYAVVYWVVISVIPPKTDKYGTKVKIKFSQEGIKKVKHFNGL